MTGHGIKALSLLGGGGADTFRLDTIRAGAAVPTDKEPERDSRMKGPHSSSTLDPDLEIGIEGTQSSESRTAVQDRQCPTPVDHDARSTLSVMQTGWRERVGIVLFLVAFGCWAAAWGLASNTPVHNVGKDDPIMLPFFTIAIMSFCELIILLLGFTCIAFGPKGPSTLMVTFGIFFTSGISGGYALHFGYDMLRKNSIGFCPPRFKHEVCHDQARHMITVGYLRLAVLIAWVLGLLLYLFPIIVRCIKRR